MAISSDSPSAKESTVPATTTKDAMEDNTTTSKAMKRATMPAKRTTIELPVAESRASVDNTADFDGEVTTNNELPSQAVLKKVDDLMLLDKDGKSIPFKNLYNGPNVTRRVLIIFIRHFFCGYCQEYIRALSSSITPAALLSLPTPTFIAIVGCGSSSLIPMYATETSCPFPIYADPKKRIYDELGMLRTLNMGNTRPGYQSRGFVHGVLSSVLQSVKMLKGGKAFQGGDYQQVGGEFLFEPTITSTPIHSPDGGPSDGDEKQLGANGNADGNLHAVNGGMGEEEKRITWCHRMRNTRDHAEIAELREVLGLESEDVVVKESKRSKRMSAVRKGTGMSEYVRTSISPTREANEGTAGEAQGNGVHAKD